LRVIAAELGTSAIKLIGGIAVVRSHKRSFSSELRLFITQYFANTSPRSGLPDPESRFSFRLEKPRRKLPRKRAVTPRNTTITG
jgi:predicted DNA-binding ribbon-helix-helix protein